MVVLLQSSTYIFYVKYIHVFLHAIIISEHIFKSLSRRSCDEYVFTFLSQNLGNLHFSTSSSFLQCLIYAGKNKAITFRLMESSEVLFRAKKRM